MTENKRQKHIIRAIAEREKITAVTVVFDKHYTYGWVHYGMDVDYLSSIDEDTVNKLLEIGKGLREEDS